MPAHRLLKDETGAVAVALTLAMIPLSFAALGAVDLMMGLRARAELQDAADAAALEAVRIGRGEPGKVSAIAAANLQQNLAGLPSDAHLQYAFAPEDEGKAVVGEASRTVSTTLYQYFNGGPLRIAVHTKAIQRHSPTCVLALDPAASGALLVSGSSRVELAACSAYANSSSGTALNMNGSAYLQAASVELVGGGPTPGSNLVAEVHTGVAPIADPFVGLRTPGALPCDETGKSADKSTRFDAQGIREYVFCGGLSINGGVVTFGPGTYVVQGGPMVINGNTTTRGKQVTFVLTGGATLQINGGATVDLSAPTSGVYAGLIFVQERTNGGAENVLNGGADQQLDGALYFPAQRVRFNGNNTTKKGCTTLVARTIEFNGDAGFSLEGCDSFRSVRLAE